MISSLEVTIFLVLISAVFTKPPLSPLYSEKHSEIRYQPSESGERHEAELNSEEKQREEVTERSGLKEARLPLAVNGMLPDSSVENFEITTEPESEQINFARFVHRNIVKDKLVEDETLTMKKINQENATQTSNVDKANTTKCHDNVNEGNENIKSTDNLESIEHPENMGIEAKMVDMNTASKKEVYDKNVTMSCNEEKGNITESSENTNLSKEDFIKKNTEEIENIQNREILENTGNEGNAEASKNIEDINESELSDLNNQGVYYIFHPEMLLQKVVYKAPEKNKYENVAPIVEHFYSYDPRTFILQRLILRP